VRSSVSNLIDLLSFRPSAISKLYQIDGQFVQIGGLAVLGVEINTQSRLRSSDSMHARLRPARVFMVPLFEHSGGLI
jgi:hypothetical protein